METGEDFEAKRGDLRDECDLATGGEMTATQLDYLVGYVNDRLPRAAA